MRKLLVLICTFTIGSTMAQNPQENLYSLRVEADNFRNSQGVAQFALYNWDGTIPDEKLKRYFKKEVGKIVNGKSFVTFEDLPKGRYAVTVLHDENSNEEIDKTLFFPKEGFGLTNFEKISLSNRPDFPKASFVLSKDAVKKIKLIYK
ncbi:DUF2141 domain-containing protein [Salinimicrobium sp. TH3]|uniref:DUF2141 domain-containing protein n=1 Tax=Salinimicrobium sp. TH3 TaxID=2997342 RepID=UPI0022761D5A|nr:DUF2141 domain-containing protein [Salinimicrobium sp. TH3]MCY2687640.1 DUF2141 domain-containing protein [Salinimicrobium sp. TH3]